MASRQYKTKDGYDITIVVSDNNPPKMTCEDCDEVFDETDGRYYKYEQGVWLCDNCHDERMEDD